MPCMQRCSSVHDLPPSSATKGARYSFGALQVLRGFGLISLPATVKLIRLQKTRIRLWGKSLRPVNPLAWQGCAAAVSVRRSRMRPLQGPLARPEQSSGGFEAHGVGFRV